MGDVTNLSEAEQKAIEEYEAAMAGDETVAEETPDIAATEEHGADASADPNEVVTEEKPEEIAEQQAEPATVDLDDTDIPAVHFAPKLTGELLPGFAEAEAEAYTAADAKRTEVEAQFEAGELTEEQMKAENRKIEQSLNAEIRKINAANTNAELDSQRWQAEQAAFFGKYSQYAETPILFNALNAEVIRLANLPECAGKTGIQVLMLAKAEVDKQLQTFTGTRLGAVASKPAIATKPKSPPPAIQTLGAVPAAAANDVGQDKFAHINSLKGAAYDAAIAALTPAQRQAYLESL